MFKWMAQVELTTIWKEEGVEAHFFGSSFHHSLVEKVLLCHDSIVMNQYGLGKGLVLSGLNGGRRWIFMEVNSVFCSLNYTF